MWLVYVAPCNPDVESEDEEEFVQFCLAQVDKIVERVVHFSGVVLPHGTQIIELQPFNDIKASPKEKGIVRSKLLAMDFLSKVEANISQNAEKELDEIVGMKKLRFFNTKESVMTLVNELLSQEESEQGLFSIEVQLEDNNKIQVLEVDNLEIFYI
jgi:hypothetical protein